AHAERLDPDRPDARTRWVSFEERGIQDAMIAQSSYPHIAAWGAFSTMELMVQAAQAGLGLTMLPTYVGDQQPSLQRLAQPDLRHVADLWILSHPDLRENARFRATRARVQETLRMHRPLFTGEEQSPNATGCPGIAPPGSDGAVSG
ncbi:MAG: DNA-binding transcriptional LysR family regulator, partial [Myxococcota bacterium]